MGRERTSIRGCSFEDRPHACPPVSVENYHEWEQRDTYPLASLLKKLDFIEDDWKEIAQAFANPDSMSLVLINQNRGDVAGIVHGRLGENGILFIDIFAVEQGTVSVQAAEDVMNKVRAIASATDGCKGILMTAQTNDERDMAIIKDLPWSRGAKSAIDEAGGLYTVFEPIVE